MNKYKKLFQTGKLDTISDAQMTLKGNKVFKENFTKISKEENLIGRTCYAELGAPLGGGRNKCGQANYKNNKLWCCPDKNGSYYGLHGAGTCQIPRNLGAEERSAFDPLELDNWLCPYSYCKGGPLNLWPDEEGFENCWDGTVKWPNRKPCKIDNDCAIMNRCSSVTNPCNTKNTVPCDGKCCPTGQNCIKDDNGDYSCCFSSFCINGYPNPKYNPNGIDNGWCYDGPKSINWPRGNDWKKNEDIYNRLKGEGYPEPKPPNVQKYMLYYKNTPYQIAKIDPPGAKPCKTDDDCPKVQDSKKWQTFKQGICLNGWPNPKYNPNGIDNGWCYDGPKSLTWQRGWKWEKNEDLYNRLRDEGYPEPKPP